MRAARGFQPYGGLRATAREFGSCQSAVVEADAIIADAERVQPVVLGGEILWLCFTRAHK